MKRLKYLLPLLALPFLSSLSCGKKPPPKPIYYMTQEFKDYVVFPEGSWWVYEDSVNAELDTISLLKTSVFEVDGEGLGFISENMLINVRSSFYKTTYNLRGGIKLPPDQQVASLTLKSNERVFQSLFFLPSKIGNAESQRLSIYKHYYDSLTVNNFVFDSVKLYESLIPSNESLPIKTYWKRNVGIIKKEMPDGSVWELINYEIK